MGTYIDKAFFLFMGIWMLYFNISVPIDVAYILAGIIILFVSYYFDGRKNYMVMNIVYGIELLAAFIFAKGICFLPIMIYSTVYEFYDTKKMYIPYGIAYLLAVIYYIKSDFVGSGYYVIFVGICFLAAMMACKEYNVTEGRRRIKRLRDDSTEKNNLLAEKNKMLTINMNNEIRIATLSERNRIAREIHDNVGHTISRAILQLGAVMTVNRNEKVYDSLVPLKDSLDTAMNNIRESVHDLHKESFNMKNAAESILSELKDYEINFSYDMSEKADKDVKYAFITILKEAVTNIEKHCRGNCVKVIINELDEYYQMLIQDNGKTGKSMFHPDAGIGISNMEERVKALKGIITFGTQDGFRIFISVPKKKGD
ncbi:MAG: histidine kinase [Butyrivibrio crossotus]|nr:histidine kinase [Butyrivibrio crossotus]MDY4028063.1 histidine kinase [Butyrivibrio crossotus]